MGCLNVIVTGSLETGPVHGLDVPRPCSGCGSEEGAVDQVARVVGLGSARSAPRRPRSRSRSRVVDAVYSRATAGAKAPKERRRAERQRERRRHRAAHAAGRRCVYGFDAEVASGPRRTSAARVARSATFSRPKPHSSVSVGRDADGGRRARHQVRRPCDANCGKLAAGSAAEVGVKRRQERLAGQRRTTPRERRLAGDRAARSRPPRVVACVGPRVRAQPVLHEVVGDVHAVLELADRPGRGRVRAALRQCPGSARAGCRSTATTRPGARAGR